MSEAKLREEEHRIFASDMSSRALAWAGIAITEFVLITTIFTALKVEINNILLQLTLASTVIDGLTFSLSSSFYMIASRPSHRLRNLKDNKTGNSMTEPRQFLEKRAELFFLVGILLQSLTVCFFLAFLELYWVLAVVIVWLIPSYIYYMRISHPRALEKTDRHDEPKQN